MHTIPAIVLGVLQGLTEFLPVSSSAHLILAPYFMKWDDPGLAFDVALHMGTLVAILAFFWRDWVEVLRQFLGAIRRKVHTPVGMATADWRLLILGTMPAAIIGKLFEKTAEEAFRNPLLIALTLAGFGLLLGYMDRRGSKSREIDTMSFPNAWKDALVIGCAQALAIIPGVSRSGITITAGLMIGLSRAGAARFSFLLSAPIIAGAGILKAKSILEIIHSGGDAAVMVFVGFVASLVSGIFALKLLTHIIRSKTFDVFVSYRLLLALAIVVSVFIGR